MIADDDAARAWLEQALAPTAAQWCQLEHFAAALITASSQQNLISASTVPVLWARHIADSAQLLLHDRRDGNELWLDLGSGAGLPGLVAGILTERPVWLIESRALRCSFLTQMVETLGLTARVMVQPMPLERLATVKAATISARAFAPLPRLIAVSTRFSAASTRWLLPKGRNAVKELAMLPRTWQGLFHVEQSLTDADSGILVGMGTVGSAGKRS